MLLGDDNPDVSLANEENGLLNWTTPAIDPFEVVEEVFTDNAVDVQIGGFRPVLQAQAIAFSSGIISTIDPEIVLEFEYTS